MGHFSLKTKQNGSQARSNISSSPLNLVLNILNRHARNRNFDFFFESRKTDTCFSNCNWALYSNLQKAKLVQDSLKKKGIDLLLVYAPGKGSFCKEFIEDKYNHNFQNTNLNLYISNSKRLGLNYLDF